MNIYNFNLKQAGSIVLLMEQLTLPPRIIKSPDKISWRGLIEWHSP